MILYPLTIQPKGFFEPKEKPFGIVIHAKKAIIVIILFITTYKYISSSVKLLFFAYIFGTFSSIIVGASNSVTFIM